MFNWFRLSLTKKITIIILSCFISTFLAVIYITFITQQHQIINMELGLARQIDTIILNSFRNLIVDNRHDVIQELIRTFGKIYLINRIHIIDERGIIRKTTQTERVGEKSVALNLDIVLKEGREIFEKEYKDKEKLWLYTIITPIKNEKSCYACHSKEIKILGALRLGFFMSAIQKPAMRLARLNIIIISIGILLTFLLLRLFLRRSIIRPVEDLLMAAQKIIEGDLEYKVPVHSQDEIGKLSDNFNTLTEKLKLTIEEVVQSTKMRTLGLLSAAVFHDLIGSIGGIRSYAQFLSQTLSQKKLEELDLGKLRGQIINIEEVAANCERIIENYYIFSGQAPKRVGEVNIGKVIEDTLKLLEKDLKAFKIETVLDMPAGLPLFFGNSHQLMQAFTNIIMNAREAMPFGGKIEIGASVRDEAPKRYLTVSFKDTGCGIPPGYLGRIFDPFFSTKLEKGNIGLGLLIVKQIIEESHKGKIKVESEAGKGTNFLVELPVNLKREKDECPGN